MSKTVKVPLFRPSFSQGDVDALADVLYSGHITTGSVCEEFERLFAERSGVKHAITTCSGSAALHLALVVSGIGHGDIVFVPSLAFASDIQVVEWQGATPVFIDCESYTHCIDAEKLDELINIVGELVITSAGVRQISERSENSDLVQPVLTMSRLVEDVRDRIMNIRMVQIGDTFKRFERIVRDLSRESGKEVDLILSGGDTELDKTIIEKISDPVMHLIRNSLDHGIGMPEDRVQKGKSRRGTIRLNAYHELQKTVMVFS